MVMATTSYENMILICQYLGFNLYFILPLHSGYGPACIQISWDSQLSPHAVSTEQSTPV